MRKLTSTLLVFILVLVSGCASQAYKDCDAKPTEEEVQECRKFVREYNDGQDRINYENCAAIFRRHGVPMVHRDHDSSHRRARAWEIKDDLMVNRCQAIIKKEAWAEHL